jgi:PAS domain S-box-containing protein
MARILIIDEIKEERDAISEFLKKEGYEVVISESGKEALRFFEKDKFDLVLIDMYISENGLQVLKEIRNRDPSLCVLIIITTSLLDKAVIALRLGAYDFVERPIKNEDLLCAVKRCLEKMVLEKKLNEANSLLDAVLSGLGEGVIVIDREMRIIAANRAFLERMNAKKEDIKGRHCYKVSHRYEICCKEMGEECPVLETFRTGEHKRAVHTHYNTHGNPFHVEVNSYPIRNEKGEIIQAVESIMDITDRVRLEEDLKERIKELEEFYDMAVGRELKMVELKNEIERLREELERYKK